jgi:two-component system sensor kinase FixL
MRRFADLPPAVSNENRPPRPEPLFDPVPPDSVVVLDELGCVQHFGPSAECLFGYREAEVLGHDFAILTPSFNRRSPGRDWLHGDNRHGAATDLPPAGAQADAQAGAEYILTGHRSDSGKFPMRLTIREVRLPGERLFTGAVRDLTPSVESDRLRRKLQAELAWAVGAGQLGHLASTVVRKAIQPLATIKDDLARGEGPFQIRDQKAARLLTALLIEIAERAATVIQDLRTLRNADAGERRAENLKHTIEMASVLALADVSQAVMLTIRVAWAATWAICDPDQIQRVLCHGITDVARSIPEPARREIAISTMRRGDMVEIVIAATGASQLAERGPPRHADPSAHSFCHAIVEAHGGEIHIDDGGMLVRFTLPAAPRDAD